MHLRPHLSDYQQPVNILSYLKLSKIYHLLLEISPAFYDKVSSRFPLYISIVRNRKMSRWYLALFASVDAVFVVLLEF
jgi:hypothetical protein